MTDYRVHVTHDVRTTHKTYNDIKKLKKYLNGLKNKGSYSLIRYYKNDNSDWVICIVKDYTGSYPVARTPLLNEVWLTTATVNGVTVTMDYDLYKIVEEQVLKVDLMLFLTELGIKQ